MAADAAAERYLLDTAIVVHYTRQDRIYQQLEDDYRLSTLPLTPLISIVTVGELHSLAIQWKWGAAKRRRLAQLIDDFVVMPLDYPGLVQAYAEIDAHCVAKGLPHGKNDVWIAATAHITSALLLTTDKDFDGLDPHFIRRRWIDPKTD